MIEIKWLQQLEDTRVDICNVPDNMGGQIFRKWGHSLSAQKNHYLVMTGSKDGQVRKLMRTNITKNDNKLETKKASAFFNKRNDGVEQ
jgi:hypothetical protein